MICSRRSTTTGNPIAPQPGKRPRREVVRVRLYSHAYCKPGEGSAEITLSCGHSVRRKQSKIPRHYVRCESCRRDSLDGERTDGPGSDIREAND